MKFLFSLLFIVYTFSSNAQELIQGTTAHLFSVKEHEQPSAIEYITISEDLTEPKPTLLFLQGSLPVPLVFDLETFKHINLPFDYKAFIDSFHIVVISMPETPVVAKQDVLNKQYCYITDPNNQQSYSKSYLKVNVLDTYVERTEAVLKDIKQKAWAKDQDIYAIGHSQGAKVASVVASKHSIIDGVALLGFNAYGRYDEFIRRERKKLELGTISHEEYLNQLNKFYEQWESIQQALPEDSNAQTWKSFSIDYTPYLNTIKCPVFIGYGTEDIIAENSDLIPLDLIEGGNTTFKIQSYNGLDHNFFEVIDGKPNRKTGAHWTDVIKDVILWFSQSN